MAQRIDTAMAGRSTSLTQVGLFGAAFIVTAVMVVTAPLVTVSSGAPLTGGGNSVRQLGYLMAFLVMLYAAGGFHDFKKLLMLPMGLVLVLLWCWASVFWAVEPGIAVRRLTLATLIICGIFIAARGMSPASIFKYLRLILVATLVANYLAVILFPDMGVHQFEAGGDPSLIGGWRGVFPEKNATGAVCAVTIILFLFDTKNMSAKLSVLVIAAAVFFLIRTGSKTSLALVGVSFLAGSAYRWYNRRYWAVTAISVVLIAFAAFAYAIFHVDELIAPLHRQDTLTGRSQIWLVMGAYVSDNWLFGAGYGSFWNVGDDSPVYQYIKSDSWLATVASGHNGYLDLAAQIGIPGAMAATYVLVIQPFFAMLTNQSVSKAHGALLTASLVFCACHNLTESTILDRDSFLQYYLVLTVALIGMAAGDTKTHIVATR